MSHRDIVGSWGSHLMANLHHVHPLTFERERSGQTPTIDVRDGRIAISLFSDGGVQLLLTDRDGDHAAARLTWNQAEGVEAAIKRLRRRNLAGDTTPDDTPDD